MARDLLSERPLIRDLSDEEFEERYSCDRFTATVLASRYRYIVQHMCSGLLTTAFSIILRDWYDFAAIISAPPERGYAVPAMSNSLVLFLGTMTDAVRNTAEEYGPERLKPGDVLACNDPYRIGTHVNDVCFTRPVFTEDEGLVGFVSLQAHMLDMGGIVPAGFTAHKHNVYETGLVLGPQLAYENNEPVKSFFSLIFDNARMGEMIYPDVQSIFQSLLLGENLLLETIGRYGADAYHGATQYACDVAAETMSEAIRAVPDGDYEGEDLVDADGDGDEEEYRISVAIRIRGGRAEVDLSGSSRQARTSINAGWLDAKTAVAVAFKFLLDPVSPFTTGSFRPIDIVLPEGTVLSALPPAGSVFLYWEPCMPLIHAIFKALKDALGENAVGGDFCCLNIHNANGVYPDGRPWVTMAQCGGEHGPWAATKVGDADSYMVFYEANNIDPATEAIEADFPVVLLRKEYVADTGGPGDNRGGAAVLKDTLWLSDVEHHAMPLHFKVASGFGVYGGGSGKRGGVWLWEPEKLDATEQLDVLGDSREVYEKSTPVGGLLDPETKMPDDKGEYFFFGRVAAWRTKPNSIFRYLTSGGGGWGDSLGRDPERVLRDVRDEYVTIEGAARDYGVVVKGDPKKDPEGLELDLDATEKLRAERRPAA
jgi:N-methylhydantoinase B